MYGGSASMKKIVKCDDGVFRWVYEFKLLNNPTILFLLWKIFGFIMLGMWVFVLALEVTDRGFQLANILEVSKGFGFAFLGMMALVLVGYLFYALIMGGKYCVLFEMDEDGVTHSQMEKQVKKSQLIAAITALAGIAAGSASAVGTGILSASKSSMRTEFAKVRKIVPDKKRGVIKVNELLMKNQVYADGEDFDFVLDYIVKRLPPTVAAPYSDFTQQ